jgi:major vault protein
MAGQESRSSSSCCCRVPPHHYIHVEDRNTMVTRLEVGPLTFTPRVPPPLPLPAPRCDLPSHSHVQLQEEVVLGPAPMVLVPREHQCVVRNPAVRDETGAVVRSLLISHTHVWSWTADAGWCASLGPA